ncbi:TPA-induced transmembrane protein isoform X2 [Protopterus annectens]|uniref:TPA-induced transmembrane protein isoform X2 n=1 Tax=Protopterus annectens TaxID=7888 RepID=UPI001CFBCBD4|nr:TPA-induced transmembrane protein isoform X2 [Protopterus annectens]
MSNGMATAEEGIQESDIPLRVINGSSVEPSESTPLGVEVEKDTVQSSRNITYSETGCKKSCNDCSTVVCWKCRLWMLLLAIFGAIVLVVIVSLVLYSVIYTDEDDIVDNSLKSTGKPQYYEGTMRLKQLASDDVMTTDKAKQMLTDVYNSSPALGRYFVEAIVFESNDTTTVTYSLKFALPPDHSLLLQYTLSEEVLVNVLKQYVCDQEDSPEGGQGLQIEPSSLILTAVNRSYT